jgi:glutathione S-transferase
MPQSPAPNRLTLYHCVSARSFRPLWTLEELELPYELHMLPFPPRALKRDYLHENPLGTVPLLLDGQCRMTESAAICHYLARRHAGGKLAVDQDEPQFGAWLNWLHFGEATLTFPQTLVLRYGRFEPQERRQPQVVEDYTRWFLARLRAVDAALAGRGYLCGSFTVADISVGYALMLADYLGLKNQFPGAVGAYWERLQERPAYARALARQQAEALAQGVPDTPAPLAG